MAITPPTVTLATSGTDPKLSTDTAINTAINEGLSALAGSVNTELNLKADTSSLGGLAAKNTVGTTDIDNLSVTGPKMADGAVTKAKMAGMQGLRVLGNITAEFGAVTDVSAAELRTMLNVNGALAAKNTVGTTDIDLGAITTGRYAQKSVTLDKIADLPPRRVLGNPFDDDRETVAVGPAQLRAMINVKNGATANATDAHLLSRSNHQGVQGPETISGLEPALRDLQNRLGGVNTRPGRNRAAFIETPLGAPDGMDGLDAIPQVTAGNVAGLGECAIVTDHPLIVAPREPIAVHPGRVYLAYFVSRRLTDPPDPSGDALQLAIQPMQANYTGLTLVNVETQPLKVNDGIWRRAATFSVGAPPIGSVDHQLSVGTVFVRPYVRTYNSSTKTAIAQVEVIDITEAASIDGALDAISLAQAVTDAQAAADTAGAAQTTAVGAADDAQGFAASAEASAIEAAAYGPRTHFETRADFVAYAAGEIVWAPGMVVWAGGVGYRFDAPSVSVLPSLSGFRPLAETLPEHFGAACDWREVSDAAMTATETTVTSATAAFTAADVGKCVLIADAGVNGGALRTTITAVTSATTATVDLAATDTRSGVKMMVGSDDTAAFQAAFFYAQSVKKNLHMSEKTYYIARPELFESTPGEVLHSVTRVGIKGAGIFQSRIVFDDANDSNETGKNINFYNGRGFNTHNRATEIDMSDFSIIGTADYHGNADTLEDIRGSQFMVVRSVERFKMERVWMEDARAQFIWTQNSRVVDYIDCAIWKGVAGGFLASGSEWNSVRGCKVFFIDDDSILVGTQDPASLVATGTRVSAYQGEVVNNQIFFSPGIKVAGGRGWTISNNTMVFGYRHGIHLNMQSSGSEKNGQTAMVGISIVGNTFLNMVDRGELDTEASGGSVIWIGAAAATGGEDEDGIPGDSDGTGIVDIYEYLDQWGGDTGAVGPAMAITITGNTISRTAKPVANFSDYGLGHLPTKGEEFFWDPEITEAALRPNAILLQGRIRGLRISDNVITGVGHCVRIASSGVNAVQITETVIENNTFLDCKGWLANTAGNRLNIISRNNRYDLDPFFLHPSRNANGSWASAGALIAVSDLATSTGEAKSVAFIGDTFANCSQVFEETQWVRDRLVLGCFVEATIGAAGFSTLNKGVGELPPPGPAFIMRHMDCDPTSATRGAILNDCPVQRTAIPTTGTWLAGTFVHNAAMTVDGNGNVLLGWLRVTTGSGHTSGTDWRTIYAATTSS